MGGSRTLEAWPTDGLERVAQCPACGGGERSLLFDGLRDWVFCCAPGAWALFRCSACSAAYLDPRPTEATIGRAYASYYTHVSEQANGDMRRGWSRQGLKNAYLNLRFGYKFPTSMQGISFAMYLLPLARYRAHRAVRHLRRKDGGRLLDVGCGNGAFLEAMRAQGWDVCGVDLDPAAVATCRGKGLDVRLGTIHQVPFPERHFDAVTLNHVIEHVRDPVAVLQRCRALTAPGGWLSLETPNVNAAGRWLFGRHWMPLDPPRHLFLVGPASLRTLCRRAGWESPRIHRAVGSHGMTGWARILRQREATGEVDVRARTAGEAASDWALEVAGAISLGLAENLVAVAQRGPE